MEEEREDLTESRNEITSKGYRFVIIWATCLVPVCKDPNRISRMEPKV